MWQPEISTAASRPNLEDYEKKVLPKTRKIDHLAENWCVGVIFDFKQDDHKSFSKFELFGFFGNQI